MGPQALLFIDAGANPAPVGWSARSAQIATETNFATMSASSCFVRRILAASGTGRDRKNRGYGLSGQNPSRAIPTIPTSERLTNRVFSGQPSQNRVLEGIRRLSRAEVRSMLDCSGAVRLALASERTGYCFEYPATVHLLLVKNVGHGHRLASSVSAVRTLRQRLAVFRNDVCTREMVLPASLG